LAREQAVDGLGKASNVGETRNQLFFPYNLPRRRILQSAEEIRPSEKTNSAGKNNFPCVRASNILRFRLKIKATVYRDLRSISLIAAE
jgi:hypothetical protein